MSWLERQIFPSPAPCPLEHDKVEMIRGFLCVIPAHEPDARIRTVSPYNADLEGSLKKKATV